MGTALTVIIPEGIRAIYSNCHEDKHSHGHGAATSSNATDQDHHHHEESSPETMIGLTLILGFIFMLIIDQVTHSLQHQSSSSSQPGTATMGSAKFFFLEDFLKSNAYSLPC